MNQTLTAVATGAVYFVGILLVLALHEREWRRRMRQRERLVQMLRELLARIGVETVVKQHPNGTFTLDVKSSIPNTTWRAPTLKGSFGNGQAVD